MKETGKFCKTCNRQVLARKNKINHIFHLLLSLLTCVWFPVWFVLSTRKNPWRCTQCGSEL